MQTILVHLSDRRWTMEAVHLACALARNNGGRVILLRLMAVTHVAYLGTELGNTPPTARERAVIRECSATAEDYGVTAELQQMQCLSMRAALVEAAELVQASIVFAPIPQSWLPFWQKAQRWWVARQMKAAHRQFFTLDEPVATDDMAGKVPSITVRPASGVAVGEVLSR